MENFIIRKRVPELRFFSCMAFAWTIVCGYDQLESYVLYSIRFFLPAIAPAYALVVFHLRWNIPAGLLYPWLPEKNSHG